jgi:hypothetical protein
VRPLIRILSGAAVCAALGCASYPKPAEALGSSEALLRTAEEEQAKSVPEAALHLQMAQEELNKARDLLKNEENEKAEQMLMKCHADAQLALALTRQSKALAQANEAQQMKSGDKVIVPVPAGGSTP